MKRITGILVFIFICSLVQGQLLNNYRSKSIRMADSVHFDTLSVIPGSLIIRDSAGNRVESTHFTVDELSATLYLKSPLLKKQQLYLSYQVFAIDFSAPYPEKTPELSYSPSVKNEFVSPKSPLAGSITNENQEGVIVNGNISRGINIGNNQNMVVNSNLDMQLSGKLSESLNIEASLTDKNIPLQPDGYNQQIREFDQVYIKVFNENHSLQMGDIQISDKNTHFLRFNRKIQGANLSTSFRNKNQSVNSIAQASAAIARGKFSRNSFNGLEGVQGPYPLSGAENEKFIVVLAGTEKIYLDGVLLERGENADYVINYNTAEITFSVKHMITKDSRIIAEFEYSDRSYNRYITYAQNTLKTEKASYTFAWFSEGDAKNQPVNFELDEKKQQLLATAGDNENLAIISGYDSVGFDKNQVRYALKDTLVNSILYDSILVQSYNAQDAVYQVKFAVVGDNKGNYILHKTNVNGKVFKWIAPLDGIPQGNYAPIQRLSMPEKKQVMITKANFNLSEQTAAHVEMAFSNFDANTFSPIQNADNKGMALKTAINHRFLLPERQLETGMNYELIHKNFTAVERFRGAEFQRDWNITSLNGNEHLVELHTALHHRKSEEIRLESQWLKAKDYEGWRNNLGLNTKWRKLSVKTHNSLLFNSSQTKESRFYRHKIQISRVFTGIEAGIKHEMEDNRRKVTALPALLGNSQKYSQSEVYLQTADTTKRTLALLYKNRLDYLPDSTRFTKGIKTHDFGFNTTLSGNKHSRLNASLKWRKLQVLNNELLENQKSEDNLLGRIDHQLNLFKRSITLNSFYEVGTGMETKKDFSYIEVAPGQGVYIWVDYNENKIPELNEFEVSPFPEEANYLRIYTPTNEYIKVYSIKLNETFQLDPARVWRNEKGLKKFASRFNNLLAYRVQQKHTQPNIGDRLNPFNSHLADSLLLNNQLSFRNQLYFNRRNPTFGADWQYAQTHQKNMLLQGFDESSIESHRVNIRWNVSKTIMITNQAKTGEKSYQSEFFVSKNYTIDFVENRVEARYQPGTTFRVSSFYLYKNKMNQLANEQLTSHELGPELKFSAPGKGTMTFKGSYINVHFNGEINSAVAYEMMEGLRPGKNYRWSAQISRNLNSFLRLTVNYHGRKSPDTDMVHTGQFSLSAVF